MPSDISSCHLLTTINQPTLSLFYISYFGKKLDLQQIVGGHLLDIFLLINQFSFISKHEYFKSKPVNVFSSLRTHNIIHVDLSKKMMLVIHYCTFVKYRFSFLGSNKIWLVFYLIKKCIQILKASQIINSRQVKINFSLVNQLALMKTRFDWTN